jgi:hypothetical protein
MGEVVCAEALIAHTAMLATPSIAASCQVSLTNQSAAIGILSLTRISI